MVAWAGENRIEVDGSDTEVFQVLEVRAHTRNVSAVAVAVGWLGIPRHDIRRVIGTVSVCESIWEDLVDHGLGHPSWGSEHRSFGWIDRI